MATKAPKRRRTRKGSSRYTPEQRAAINRQRTEQATAAILDVFRSGELPQALATIYLAGEMPSQSWSIRNQLLALQQGGHPDARGYDQWRQAGRPVKRGSRASVFILKPILKAPEMERLDAEGNVIDAKVVVGYRPIPLFSIFQTEGPNPELHEEALEGLPLRALAKRWGINVVTFPGQGGPIAGSMHYRLDPDGHRVPETITLGVSGQRTFVHELVHAAEAKLGVPQESEKIKKEIVAQLGASTLLHLIGRPVEADVGYTFTYIRSYVLETNPKAGDLEILEACTAVLERIHAAVSLIVAEAQDGGLLDEELQLVETTTPPVVETAPAVATPSGHPDLLPTAPGSDARQLSLF